MIYITRFQSIDLSSCPSNINNKIENEEEGQQVAEQENHTALVFVVGPSHKIDEALWPVVSLVVFGDGEAHNNANNEPAEVTQVIDIGLGESDLDVEQQDE